MRVLVVSVPAQRKETPEYVKALARGIEAAGHRVDIMDGWTEDGFRLPGYDYIAVCAEPVSFWSGKMPGVLAKILAAPSSLVGKKGAAFLKKTGPLFINKAIRNLMRAMEKEGMKINWSDVILNAPHAEALGKRINS